MSTGTKLCSDDSSVPGVEGPFVSNTPVFDEVTEPKNDVQAEVSIRECETLEEFSACVELQQEVFGVSDADLLPMRYFVAARSAGGWTLGAFSDGELIGFVLSLNAFINRRRAFYSHLAAVSRRFESKGIGARLKWAQRSRSLAEGVDFIRWAIDPAKARNAFFSLEKLGGVIREYKQNYQGCDILGADGSIKSVVLESDRVFVDWHLESEKVCTVVAGNRYLDDERIFRRIRVPNDWLALIKTNPIKAISERARIRDEFESAFAEGLICHRFRRDDHLAEYLLVAG